MNEPTGSKREPKAIAFICVILIPLLSLSMALNMHQLSQSKRDKATIAIYQEREAQIRKGNLILVEADHQAIMDAIAIVKTGRTVELGAGVVHMTITIAIGKDIRLQGATRFPEKITTVINDQEAIHGFGSAVKVEP